jgi:chemotaxis protein MotB
MRPFTGFGGRNRRGRVESLPDHEYWLSYSDLLAGLLMVFTLMLLAALYTYQSGVEGVYEILSVRQEVIEDLQRQFQEGETRVVEVQPDGTVRFADQVLFEENSADLSPEGREQLQAFARQYVQLIFGTRDFEDFRRQLEAIVVEGHTNDNGSYVYNLALSQARAFAVMEVLLGEAAGYQAQLQRYVTANGRSFAALVCQDSTVDQRAVELQDRCRGHGGVDKGASRRIEIRFQLRDGNLLQDLLELLSAQ